MSVWGGRLLACIVLGFVSMPGASTAEAPIGGVLERLAESESRSEAGPSSESLAPLLEELPRTHESGRLISPVAFLGSAPKPGWKAIAHAWLAPIIVDQDALDAELERQIRGRYQLVDREPTSEIAGALAAVRSLGEDPDDIAAVNSGLGVAGSITACYRRGALPGSALEIELRLTSGRTPPGAQASSATIQLDEGFSKWNPRTAAFGGALVLLFLASLMRGRGTLVVQLERGHKPDPSIVYTAYIGKQSLRTDTHGARALASQPIAAKQATFDRLPVREYFIAVRRVQRDPKTHQVVSNVAEERTTQIRRGATQKVRFEFLADLVAVEVALTRGKKDPIEGQALVAIAGDANSSRYARDGGTTLHLSPGRYPIRIGYLDRAFEVPLEVPKDAGSLSLKVDVDAVRRAVFTDCVAAVTPFVNGNLDSAIEILEQKGFPEAAAKLQRMGKTSTPAPTGPANQTSGKTEPPAASPTEKPAAEAAAPVAPEDPREAAFWHLQAGRFDEALAAASACNDHEVTIRVLVEKGDLLEAAHLALKVGDRDGAIAALQRISLSDPRFGEACLLLAQLFCDRDEPSLALDKLNEAVDVFGSETSLELREQIAQAFERCGQIPEALAAYEHIRKRDIAYPGTAEKIETLRDLLKQATRAPVDAKAGQSTGSQATSRFEDSRYELQEEIGRGGMGVVFRARDRTLGRMVALKRLPENLKEHQTVVRLFLREARSAAALNHPNIVTLHDAGQEAGNYYLTMEHLVGTPLNVLLKQRGSFKPLPAMRIALQAIDGLAYAHGEGIIHRDIKPSNLFLTEKQVVKIMDFGLAKMIEEVRKSASMIAGTPYYMSPEQSIGGVVDPRSDLYSFGVSLFEFLTGTVPFREGDVAYHHRHTEPPDPRSLNPEIPERLAQLVLRLLAKDPGDRPANADEVAAELRELIRQQ